MDLAPLIASFLIIGLAEMGDKTQLLTLTLSAKYPMEKVLCGIFSASAALMAIAVLAGGLIQRIVPALFISILAGAFFIIYGLMIIVPIKKRETAEENKGREIQARGAFWTVFGSFFLAELGDKTQLAAFALAARYGAPVQTWIGATAGIVLANLFGIVIGNMLKDYLPERIINYMAGAVFILFGAITFLSVMLNL